MRMAALVIALIFLSSCVSVKLASDDHQKAAANKISFADPSNPFSRTDLSQADRAWQSPATGNSISFFSDCKLNGLPLKALRTSTFTGIDALKIIDEETSSYNDREALKSIVLGKMEGVPIKINLILFRKNLCTYSLSYVALLDQYERELKVFNDFVAGFKVYD